MITTHFSPFLFATLLYNLVYCVVLFFFSQFSYFLKHFRNKQFVVNIFICFAISLCCIFMYRVHPFLQQIYVGLGNSGLSQSDNNASTTQQPTVCYKLLGFCHCVRLFCMAFVFNSECMHYSACNICARGGVLVTRAVCKQLPANAYIIAPATHKHIHIYILCMH